MGTDPISSHQEPPTSLLAALLPTTSAPAPGQGRSTLGSTRCDGKVIQASSIDITAVWGLDADPLGWEHDG